MRMRTLFVAALLTLGMTGAFARSGIAAPMPATATLVQDDPTQVLVDRLTLDNYKATLKGLTQFGDRRQGTQRNRDAVDWIEAQLQSVGCTNTARITYEFDPPPRTGGGRARRPLGANGSDDTHRRPGRPQRQRSRRELDLRLPGAYRRQPQPRRAARRAHPRAQPRGAGERRAYRGLLYQDRHDSARRDVHHRRPHGRPGVNEAVNDDGSGTAVVMELARIFSAPDVETEVSIRFVLWNNEETDTNGARAYIAQRQELQGIESPAGSGRYPEPTWLGMIQHDMMLWDHGAPRSNGTVSRNQRPEADVNIEFQSNSELAEESMKLAFVFKAAADAYNTDYPATVGPHMTNTDSGPFMNIVPSISLRENERGAHTGAGWNPTWHTPLDVWTTFTDQDFRLGLNAAQTTLSALSQLTGATVGGR